MRERRAEVRHAPPYHEAADRTGRSADPDPAGQRAQEEILGHECSPSACGPSRTLESIGTGSPVGCNPPGVSESFGASLTFRSITPVTLVRLVRLIVPRAGMIRHRLAERVVAVIVRMLIDRERARHMRTEQGDELRGRA